jgi:hypothetical protein
MRCSVVCNENLEIDVSHITHHARSLLNIPEHAARFCSRVTVVQRNYANAFSTIAHAPFINRQASRANRTGH